MSALSEYKMPIVVEKEKFGLWRLGQQDDRVERAEREREALESAGAAMAASAVAQMNATLASAPSYTPSFAELDTLPKWTPARWTHAHWTAASLPMTSLPVTERYKRSATSWGIGTLMEHARQEQKRRADGRLRIPNPYH